MLHLTTAVRKLPVEVLGSSQGIQEPYERAQVHTNDEDGATMRLIYRCHMADSGIGT